MYNHSPKDYKNQIQGAESQEDFAEGIKKAFSEITSSVNYTIIGIVTHDMPFWVIFGDILNDREIVNVSDCAYAILDKEGQKITVERLVGIEYKVDKGFNK